MSRRPPDGGRDRKDEEMIRGRHSIEETEDVIDEGESYVGTITDSLK